MAQGKRSKLEEREGVVYKECSKCGRWKVMNQCFVKDARGVGGRKSSCKECNANSARVYYEENAERMIEYGRKWRSENVEYRTERDRKYRERTADQRAESSRNWYKRNRERALERNRIYREKNTESTFERGRRWRKNNPDKAILIDQRRRARKAALPSDFTSEQMSEVLTYFNGGCALTGDTDNVTWDHVIAVSTGHGGTTKRNMIPMRRDLNGSKNDANIFEWFDRNKERFEMSHLRFDILVDWLSSINYMTTNEYRDYVYWCNNNPRSLDITNESEGA